MALLFDLLSLIDVATFRLGDVLPNAGCTLENEMLALFMASATNYLNSGENDCSSPFKIKDQFI